MEVEILKVDKLYKSFHLADKGKVKLSNIILKFIGFFQDNQKKFNALEDVSFSLKKGEILGIIGKNGSGKSTLLKILSEIMYPSKGEITYKGKLTSILDVGTGFHNELSGRENAFMYASLLGLEKDVVEKGMSQIIEFSEIGEFIDQPVKYYSNGMYLRLAFAVAFFCNVEIMLLDEVLYVGDSAFMIKSHKRIQQILEEGTSIILVSHSMSDVLRLCKRCIWLENGKIKKLGPAPDVVAAYLESNWLTKREGSSIDSISNFEWNNNNGPANEYLKLKRLTICSEKEKSPNGIIDYNDNFQIKIQYEQLVDYGVINFTVIIIDHFNTGITITTPQFSEHDITRKFVSKGIYETICTIPKQFLNIGFYRIHLRVTYDDIEIMEELNIALFRIEASNERQKNILIKTPLSVSASFDWSTTKLS
jgi:ABC-type polysaccharide/polyol phosphate transport system ATPase subunit